MFRVAPTRNGPADFLYWKVFFLSGRWPIPYSTGMGPISNKATSPLRFYSSDGGFLPDTPASVWRLAVNGLLYRAALAAILSWYAFTS